MLNPDRVVLSATLLMTAGVRMKNHLCAEEDLVGPGKKMLWDELSGRTSGQPCKAIKNNN